MHHFSVPVRCVKAKFEPKKFDNLTAEQMKEYLVLNSSKSKDDYNNTMVKDLKKEMLFLSMLDGSICVPKIIIRSQIRALRKAVMMEQIKALRKVVMMEQIKALRKAVMVNRRILP